MEYKILTPENFRTVNWSGGISTELFIFPPAAVYKQLDFQFRLSRATVETEKSDFTELPGISRKLMILHGKITISHEGHYSRQLDRFEVDEFEGDWKTTSLGKCTDFNLMTAGNISGKLNSIIIRERQNITYAIEKSIKWFFIYLNEGKVTVELNDKIATTGKGELLVVNNPDDLKIEIKGIDHSELVFSEIKYNHDI